MTRIDKLREKLNGAAALIENTHNRAYFTEFASSAGTLLVTGREALLIIDFRYIEAARSGVSAARVELQGEDLPKQIAEYLEADGITAVKVESEMSLGRRRSLQNRIKGIEFIDDGSLSSAAASLRSVKETAEIEKIKASQAITDRAFLHILTLLRPGITEREIAAEIDYFMRRDGSDGNAFPTIAVSGKNSSLPHGVPSDKAVEAGDFVVMDYGAIKDGYCSDMTRTVAVGHATEEMKNVYATVLRAHLAVRDRARAGITGKMMDAFARDLIYEAGYRGLFGHGLGHSLGLEIHEEPRANTQNGEPLPAGVIMTVEPGIYIPGRFGVRIENMVVLTDSGNQNLTASPTDLIVV